MIPNTFFFIPFLIIIAYDLEELQVGGWFESSSQTLLLINCPCFIYIPIFEVIFPRWSRMEPNLPGSIYPQTLTLILSE